jgi:hypothetical protein
MAESDPRTHFVITLRGDRGPHSRAEILELLRAGEIQSGDRLRNAFGRQLGTVEDLIAAHQPRRAQPPRPVATPPDRRPSMTPVIVAIIAAIVLLALWLLASGRADPPPAVPQPAPPVQPEAGAPPQSIPEAPKPPPGRLEGWTVSDIGGGVAAPEVEVRPGGRWWVASAGSDIWSASDQFRLVSRPLPRDGHVIARVHSTTGQHGFAKLGVMLRSSAAPTAAFVLLSFTPGGGGELLVRAADGGLAEAKSARHQGLPRWLRLARDGNRITPSWSEDGQSWQPAGDPLELPGLTGPLLAGIAVCSHEEAVMTAVFSEVAVESAR